MNSVQTFAHTRACEFPLFVVGLGLPGVVLVVPDKPAATRHHAEHLPTSCHCLEVLVAQAFDPEIIL